MEIQDAKGLDMTSGIDPMERVLVAFRAMNSEEQRELVRRLVSEVYPLVEAAEEEAPKMGARKKRRHLYWIKRVTGWDESKKKGFRLEGEFVRPERCSEGELLAMGVVTERGKMYFQVRVEPTSSLNFKGPDDVGVVTVEGVRSVRGPYTDWDTFETAIRA
jgi:hypothetical protein